MNDLILSVFMTVITGQQAASLNADCATIIKKEKLAGKKNISIEQNTISVIDKKSNTAKLYLCGSKDKKIMIFAQKLSEDQALSIYNTLYTASTHQFGKAEIDSKHLKNRILNSVAEVAYDIELEPSAEWDIGQKNSGSLSILKTNNAWSVVFSIAINKRVNCGGPVGFKACKEN